MPERDHITTGQLLLAEYQAIKDEQKARIGFRDNLLYVTLAVVAAVIAAAGQAKQTAMLLALPPVCVVLGWTYLVNDDKISAIGKYVRGDLGPRLAELAGGQQRGIGLVQQFFLRAGEAGVFGNFNDEVGHGGWA